MGLDGQSLFSAAFLLLGGLPTESASGKAAIRGGFLVEPAASLVFDVDPGSVSLDADAAKFSFLRADVLEALPVAGVCSSCCTWRLCIKPGFLYSQMKRNKINIKFA